jgi:nitroreductase/NAD-dependent dihydropyrimidine dehydrogenase PreA subunit
MPEISIDEERCTRCGGCVAVCTSARVFEMGDATARAVRPEECWLCGHCVAVCPVDAVRHAEFPLDACPVIESPPSYEALITAFRERRSLRVFRDKPVPRETVRQLVDAARWVPSASNQQPVDWIALDDPERIGRLSDAVVTTMDRTAELLNMRILRPLLSLVYGRAKIRDAVEAAEDFDKLARAYARGEDPILHRAPVVLAAHVPKGAFFGRDDAVYAAYNLMLAAERLGLGTCHIGYVNAALERNQRIVRILGLPAERQLEVVLTLGYPRFTFRRAVPRRRMALVWNPPYEEGG